MPSVNFAQIINESAPVGSSKVYPGTPYLTVSVPEGCSFPYSAVFVQSDGKTPIPNGSLLTLTLTLTDAKTGRLINGRQGVTVLNANGGVLDVSSNPATGNFSWVPLPADNPISEANPNIPNG